MTMTMPETWWLSHEKYQGLVRDLAGSAGATVPDGPVDEWGRVEWNLREWHDYGGVLIEDTECLISYGPHLRFGVRTEPNGARFAWGTFAFDLDGEVPDLAARLAKTGLPWALARTPRGWHVHYLGEFWWPNSPRAYPGEWRGTLLLLWQALLGVGLRPDPKHTWGSFLQTRCYVRLAPKPGSELAFEYAGTVGDLPDDEDGGAEDWDSHPPARLALEAVRALCRAAAGK